MQIEKATMCLPPDLPEQRTVPYYIVLLCRVYKSEIFDWPDLMIQGFIEKDSAIEMLRASYKCKMKSVNQHDPDTYIFDHIDSRAEFRIDTKNYSQAGKIYIQDLPLGSKDSKVFSSTSLCIKKLFKRKDHGEEDRGTTQNL